jgi:hypothetical protein
VVGGSTRVLPTIGGSDGPTELDSTDNHGRTRRRRWGRRRWDVPLADVVVVVAAAEEEAMASQRVGLERIGGAGDAVSGSGGSKTTLIHRQEQTRA